MIKLLPTLTEVGTDHNMEGRQVEFEEVSEKAHHEGRTGTLFI